jgi:RNA polymerase sigma-54 factor
LLKTSQQLRLAQTQKMMPAMQQVMRMLQLSALELQAELQQYLEGNVMLEVDEEAQADDFAAAQPLATTEMGGESVTSQSEPEVEVVDDAWSDQSVGPAENPWSAGEDDRERDIVDTSGQTLREHLLEQLEFSHLSARDQAIGLAIIDAVDEDGRLADDLAAIAATLRPDIEADASEIARVLADVQRFEPAGVAARSLGECLLLQLQRLDPDTPGLQCALTIARDHLALVPARGQDPAALRRVLPVTEEALQAALVLLRGCNARPGASLAAAAPEYVVPDVLVRRSGRGWTVEINPAAMPRLRINQSVVEIYQSARRDKRSPREGFDTMRAQLQDARFLLKSLEKRDGTLLEVARVIVARQHAFLDLGEEHMQPMTRREVAPVIDCHESTVSRIVSRKYMHTPRGVFEFAYFFSSKVQGDDGASHAARAIRARIRKLIRDEDRAAPLSDSRIAELLSAEGIPVARRTVAKYRELEKLAPSNERRQASPQ